MINLMDNEVSSLDVSQNTNLQQLVCLNNHLSSLDVSGNTSLTTLACDGNQITASFYKDEKDCYIDLSAYSLDGGKISNVENGSYDMAEGRITLTDTLKVDDSLTYDYDTGNSRFPMTVTVIITSVTDMTVPSTEASAIEHPSTEGISTEAPSTELPDTDTVTTEDQFIEHPTTAVPATEINGTSSDSGAATTAAGTAQKNTPKTGDMALPVWIGLLGICAGISYLATRKRKGDNN